MGFALHAGQNCGGVGCEEESVPNGNKGPGARLDIAHLVSLDPLGDGSELSVPAAAEFEDALDHPVLKVTNDLEPLPFQTRWLYQKFARNFVPWPRLYASLTAVSGPPTDINRQPFDSVLTFREA